MKYIISHHNFNESKGISDSCEIVLYKIWSKIENDIINSISNDDNKIYIEYDDIYIRTMKINRLLNKNYKVLIDNIVLDRDLMEILIV